MFYTFTRFYFARIKQKKKNFSEAFIHNLHFLFLLLCIEIRFVNSFLFFVNQLIKNVF